MDARDDSLGQYSFPYEARSLDEIVRLLQAERMTFRTFECVSEGEYSPEDAAWNYMDVPHLTYVHKQVEGVLTFASDAVTASVFFQRIPFAILPLPVMTYQTAKNQVTYYTSFGFYILLIETSWWALDSSRTRVVTRYAVGWTGWLASAFYPAIRWLLLRNYRILMSEDLPMRCQRGSLRRRGYDFRMTGDIPSFIESRKILQTNVLVPPQNVIAPESFRSWGEKAILFDTLTEGTPLFIGEADHLGLAVVRSGNQVSIYSRLCPHEGAQLDGAVIECSKTPKSSCVLQCPWHGRKFKPIVSFTTQAEHVAYETPWHRYEIESDGLRIRCKSAIDKNEINPDWTQPATVAT